MYNSTLFLTSALDGMGGQHHAPKIIILNLRQFNLYCSKGFQIYSDKYISSEINCHTHSETQKV